MRVLVVDDARSVRVLSARMVERLGAVVQAAENGREAVEAVAKMLLHDDADDDTEATVAFDLSLIHI